jgi:CRISPR-associated protein Cmr3
MSGLDWTRFRLVPDDVLFFRDGKPSTLGADHYLRSLFPPYPSTLYGALRTRRLLDKDVVLRGLDEGTWRERLGGLVAELGEWGKLGSLALRGPWFVLRGERLVPAPLDLGVTVLKEPSKQPRGAKDEAPRVRSVARYRLLPQELSGGSSHPLSLLSACQVDGDGWREWPVAIEGEARPAEGWYLRPAGLEAWRRGGVPAPDDFVHPRCLWEVEARTGVGLEDDRRASRQGRLYTFGFLRLLPGVALGFEAAGGSLTPGSHLRLGGEGRTVTLEAEPADMQSPAKAAGIETAEALAGRLCLSLVTPGLSASGGYPPGFGSDRLVADLGGRPVRLVSAALPAFVTVGGWDLARHQAKPLRRALPAGSTFLFEPVDGGTVQPADFDGISLSDYDDEGLVRQGFGFAVAGRSF